MTKQFEWTPTEPGEYPLTVEVKDSQGNVTEQTIMVKVEAVPSPTPQPIPAPPTSVVWLVLILVMLALGFAFLAQYLTKRKEIL